MVQVNNLVFISSVAADARWRKLVRLYLKSHQQAHGTIFDTQEVTPGEDVESIVNSALGNAKVAVALVSASYLASKEISSHQLPFLISAARLRRLRLIPVIVHACSYEVSLLAHLHPFNMPKEPLSALSPSARRAALVRLSALIVERSELRSDEASQPQSVLTDTLLNDSTAYIKAVRARRFIRNLPSGLERELATNFYNIEDVRRIIDNGSRLLAEAFPCIPGEPVATALPLSYVTFSNGARVAWESAISEAARVGPLALAAILLAARLETDNQLPILLKTLGMILARAE